MNWIGFGEQQFVIQFWSIVAKDTERQKRGKNELSFVKKTKQRVVSNIEQNC